MKGGMMRKSDKGSAKGAGSRGGSRSAKGFASHSEKKSHSEKSHGKRRAVKSTARREVVIRESYQLVVQCEDEEGQRELYERLRGEGFVVRVRTL
jgi:hypothetical protein